MALRRKQFNLFLCLVVAAVWVVRGQGQTTAGTILGAVADETGARVPRAAVTITNLETGITRALTSDEAGRYRAPNLPPGSYEVRAELSGFRTAVRRGFQLTVGSEAVIDLTLSVGAVSEQVEVTAEAPLVDTTSSSVSGVVADQQVRELPLNGRSFESLIFLQSGISPFLRGDQSTEAGAGTKLAISGSRIDANSFLLDGTNMNDQSNMTPGSAAGVLLGVETLREFRVLTSNYSAEYGRVSGGVVNAVTKSGTNELHGNLFEYIRNDNLDARNFFDARKPEFKRNQFGATLGGRIIRDRTFFFGSYEGLRERRGDTRISFVPIAEAREGFLYDGTGQLRFVGVNAAVRPYLNLFPLPNGPALRTATGVLTNTATFTTSLSKPTREDFGNVRMDHQFSSNHSFYVRYTIDDSHTEDSNPNLLLLPIASRNQYGTLSETAIFSPTVVNVARLAINRSFSSSDNKLLFDVPQSLWFIPGQQFGVITFGTAGTSGALDNLGNIISQPQAWAREAWTVTDDLTLTRGRQTIKSGFLLDRYRENGLKHRIFGGQYDFESLEAFLANRPFAFQFQTPTNDPIRGWRQFLIGAYVQDDIQLRQNLTLNLGLRYEFASVPTEVNGKLANYPDPETNIAFQPHIGDPWFDGPSKDFGPRVGLAWDPFSNGKTSIRAGFGLYFDHATGAPWNRAIARVYPFHQFLNVRNSATTPVTFPRPDPSLIRDADPLNLVSYSIKGVIKDPTKVSWTFSLQQEAAPNTVVSASYVGSHSDHTTLASNGNAARPQVDPATGRRFVPQPARFRNPNLGQVQFFVFNEGNAFYNGLQLGVLRRMARGFQAQLSYTWSKTISEGDGILGRFFDREGRTGATVLQDPDNIGGDRSLAQTDFRHVATINFTYALPFAQGMTGLAGTILSGWSLNSIVTAASGNPVGLVLGFDRTNSRVRGGNSGDRPDLKPGGSNSPVLGGPDRYYDATQFELPPLGFFGNLGRQTLIGPGLGTVDFSLLKSTALRFLSESSNLQFRAEFFNILNRANFGLPFNQPITNTGAPAARAGKIDRTLTDARQIQFALKLTF